MYGEETKASVAKIHKIYNATNSIGNIDWLDWNTSYALSRLNDQAESVIKAINKEKQKQQKVFQEKLKKAETEEEKNVIQTEFVEIMEGISEKEETIGIPKITIEQFKCKKAFKTLVKVTAQDGKEYTETKEFQEGQILVPQVFLNLMGEYIKE
jgi:hypothetical protein